MYDLVWCEEPESVRKGTVAMDESEAWLRTGSTWLVEAIRVMNELDMCGWGMENKFWNQDGDWVEPDEIEEALEAYRASSKRGNDLFEEPRTAERWDQWIEFLEGAAEHDGFRCY